MHYLIAIQSKLTPQISRWSHMNSMVILGNVHWIPQNKREPDKKRNVGHKSREWVRKGFGASVCKIEVAVIEMAGQLVSSLVPALLQATAWSARVQDKTRRTSCGKSGCPAYFRLKSDKVVAKSLLKLSKRIHMCVHLEVCDPPVSPPLLSRFNHSMDDLEDTTSSAWSRISGSMHLRSLSLQARVM